ncbi:hypothetical protein C3468_16115 [Serratia marcescens]|nr:hypothetical protein C3468_16115 [Serratia marcescens]
MNCAKHASGKRIWKTPLAVTALGRWGVANQNFKPGSLRYFDEEIGAHVVSEPGSTSYSSTAMAATEFFNGIEWLPVDGDETQEKAL